MGITIVVASGLVGVVLASAYVYRRTGQVAWAVLLLAAWLGRGLIDRMIALALFRGGERELGFRGAVDAALPEGTTQGDVLALEWGLFLWLLALLAVWAARGARTSR